MRFLIIILLLPLLTLAQRPALINGQRYTSSFDTDAQAFFTATGITDATIQNGINTFVVSLKNHSLWTKVYAIYPLVGGTATTCKYNLKDPRDLDAAFRLSFVNSPTISSTGVDWNGSSQYANTFFTPSTNGFTTTNAGLTYYSRENVAAAAEIEMGAIDGNSPFYQIFLIARYTGDLAAAVYGANAGATTTSNTNSTGVYDFNRNSGNNEVWKNGTRIINAAQTAGVTTKPIYIGAENNNSTSVDGYSTKQCGFAAIHQTLTSTEEADWYNDISALMTALSR